MRTSVGAGFVAGLACAVLLVVWVGTELPEWAETLGVGRSVARVSAESPVREAAAGETLSYGFDSDTAGHLPAAFHTALTGRGTPGRWQVTADTSAPSKPNVLAQLSTDRTDYRFPLAILDAATFRDPRGDDSGPPRASNLRGGGSETRPPGFHRRARAPSPHALAIRHNARG